MHINSHFTPANFGLSSRPDHAANAPGRAQQAEATPKNAAAAAAATEETAETKTPGHSVAHQARGHLNTLQGLDGHNLGWLVSQIAQGTFDESAYAAPGESTEETGEGESEAATTSTETTAAVEEDTTASTTDETTDETAEAAVADLVDELLEDGEEDGEDDSEVT